MQADQSAFVDFSTGIKGDGLLWPGSHCSCGCKRSDGLRCWSRDIAGTQRHPTMQNYQQNSYNINAGYYINLLTVGYNLPAVFFVDINALSVIQRVSAIAGGMCRHCWFVIFPVFLCTPSCFLNVFCQIVCVGNVLRLWWTFDVIFVLCAVFHILCTMAVDERSQIQRNCCLISLMS